MTDEYQFSSSDPINKSERNQFCGAATADPCPGNKFVSDSAQCAPDSDAFNCQTITSGASGQIHLHDCMISLSAVFEPIACRIPLSTIKIALALLAMARLTGFCTAAVCCCPSKCSKAFPVYKGPQGSTSCPTGLGGCSYYQQSCCCKPPPSGVHFLSFPDPVYLHNKQYCEAAVRLQDKT